MAAVMKHDVGGGAAARVVSNLLRQFCCDAISGGFHPVAGHGIPCDRYEADGACDAQDGGAARAEGWTEEADGLSGDLGESVAGAGELVADLVCCGASQVGVAPGVIADKVAGVGDAACECGLGLRKTADHEEGGADMVLGKDIEEARRPGGIGTVVEGESQFAGSTRRDEGAAEDLRSGPERSVSVSTTRQSNGCGDSNSCGDAGGEGGKHNCT